MLRKALIPLTALLTALTASALNPLPMDPDVRTGTLPNGLKYYIRHNENPADRADFFIAMNVGSVNEEENQRGLAHFLEHMAFNGSKHFPGNSLISYLESIGVKFGANLNAYTSTDETVYNICDVPTTRQSSLDSCLLILRDWSGDLTLDPNEIDAERGVIKGEWRQRNGQASTRLLEKALPEVYPGSVYGRRMPIGLMSVVDNFRPDELRDYYARWYHPGNQCVIVVGDIDPDTIEQRIRSLWADCVPAANASISRPVPVAYNAAPIASVQTDPEQSSTNLQIYLKHDDLPDSLSNTIEELRRDAISSLVSAMLAERLTEIENAENSPVSRLAVGDIKFLLSRTQPALIVRAPSKNGRAADAVRAIATELKRAAVHGFLPTELQRAKIDLRTEADNDYTGRTSVTNTEYARAYVRHYTDGGALPSAVQKYKMLKGVIPAITLQQVNDYMRSLVAPDAAGTVIIAYVPESDTLKPADLTDAFTSVRESELSAWEEKSVEGPLLTEMPAAGTITAEQQLSQFDATVWTLSNGIRVFLRPCDKNPNSVLIQGYSPGGFSQHYDPAFGPDYKMTNDVLAVSGYGPYTTDQLRRLLVGKNVRSAVTVDNMEETVGAVTTPASLTEAMQMIYLRSTGARRDDRAFNTLMDNTRTRLGGQSTNPTFAMGDSIHSYVYNRHPLGAKLTVEGCDSVNYDRILDIYRDRFADMSDFSFFITGNFSLDSIRPLVETYLASLPGNGRMEKPRDIGYGYAKGRSHHRFTMPMANPQTIAYTFYNTPCSYNLTNVITGHALGQIAQSKLLADLREKRGWTYGVKIHIGIGAGLNGSDPANMIMPVYIRVAPENADSTFAIVAATIESLADPAAISGEELDKVKKYMAKSYTDNADDNVYWITVMHMYDKFGRDMHSDYLSILDRLTAADLAAFARTYLLPANRIQLEMSPAADR